MSHTNAFLTTAVELKQNSHKELGSHLASIEEGPEFNLSFYLFREKLVMS